MDFDNALIMEAKNLEKIGGSIQIQQINVKAQNVESLGAVSEEIREKLKEHKAGDNNFTVAYGEEITHPASALFSIVSGMLTLVAGISLLVGGVGVRRNHRSR